MSKEKRSFINKVVLYIAIACVIAAVPASFYLTVYRIGIRYMMLKFAGWVTPFIMVKMFCVLFASFLLWAVAWVCMFYIVVSIKHYILVYVVDYVYDAVCALASVKVLRNNAN